MARLVMAIMIPNDQDNHSCTRLTFRKLLPAFPFSSHRGLLALSIVILCLGRSTYGLFSHTGMGYCMLVRFAGGHRGIVQICAAQGDG